MKTFLRFYLLINVAMAPALLCGQKAPQPLYTVNLSKSISQELDINPTGTLVFLSDSTLAVSICRNLRCNLETFDLESSPPRVITSRIDEFPRYSALFRASDGRLILDGALNGTERGATIFNPQLEAPLVISKADGLRQPYLSTTGSTFVSQMYNSDSWAAYTMTKPPQRLLAGTGRVLAVSDEAVAYVDQGTVHIEGLNGRSLGSFAAKSNALSTHFSSSSAGPAYIPTIRFLGHDRLWSENRSNVEILDFTGNTVEKFEKPDGRGFRIGQSSDGSRILYDRYTRHIPLAQKVKEEAIASATLGMGAGEEMPNGEMVLVMDTRSGKPCFEWSGRTNLLLAGQFHADINPSGHLVAIMTRTDLMIYKLPEDCATN